MIPELRRQFNQQFTAEKYQHFLKAIDERAGAHVKYRQCETPCFFPKSLLDECAAAGADLMTQLIGNAAYAKASSAVIPPEFNVPNEASHPLFVQADFGLIRNANGALEPRLVEIQGFPSVYAYQPMLAEQYRESYGLDPGLRHLLSALDASGYRDLLGRAILNGHDPENVVLLEVDPENQKTLPDFTATRRMFGIPYVCVTKVKKRGRRLFYESEGREIEIRRIYNRAIVDELVRRNIKAAFDWRDDLDVEWAGHPNWYFRLSKFSIPFFRHHTVPKTSFLSDIAELPSNLENYVLKPLFSFAGIGVSVGPTRAEIDAIPQNDRCNYILQERVHFESVIETPPGPTKAEIRVMYIWMDQPVATTTIIRMGRGKMMGVDHNKNMDWVGASAAFYPD